MNKKLFVVLASCTISLFLLSSSITVFSATSDNFTVNESVNEADIPKFDKVVFITWDGTRSKWFEELSADGTLGNVSRVLENGYKQRVRITTHVTSTDPGLSTMETGYGDAIHGISSNQFGPGSSKISIPDGLTTTERLKAFYGDAIKTGMFLPWSFHQINEDYMLQEGNYTDTIFANIEIGKDVDYWFASENLSWTPDDNESIRAIYEGFPEDSHGFHSDSNMFATPLLKSSYIAEQIVKFLDLYGNDSFYIRTHFTEPDTVGHGYFESKEGVITPQYKEALIWCDEATGIILNALESKGLLEDTLVIIGSDHGFYKESHDGEPWPNGKVDVTEQTFAISQTSLKTQQEIPIAQMDISPTILGVLGVDLSTIEPAYTGEDETGIPFWERIDDDAPKLEKVQYQLESQYIPRDFENGSKIKEVFDLYIKIREWSEIKEVTLVSEDKTIEPSIVSNTEIVWKALDRNKLGSGSHSLLITITDKFDYTTQITININAGGIPFNLLYSLIALPVIAIPVLLRKKRN
ncbi:MAG: alkaline phosphatase family protein [Candidatus Heimdallarchaeaceae archaeon]